MGDRVEQQAPVPEVDRPSVQEHLPGRGARIGAGLGVEGERADGRELQRGMAIDPRGMKSYGN